MRPLSRTAMTWIYIALAAIGALAITSQICRGDDVLPMSRIILPQSPVLVEPDKPRPVVDPSDPKIISEIRPDEMYVIESSVRLIVLTSPAGVLAIDTTEGPIRVRGKFSDGTGSIETRNYSSAWVYFVTAAGPGKAEVILIPDGVTLESDIVRQVLTVAGVGPRPPPIDPDDPVIPDPPTPVTPSKLQILIVEDPALRATIPAQVAIMDGGWLREYAATHCTITDGAPDVRKLSPRQDVSNQPQWIKTAFDEPRTSLPFLVIMTPTQKIAGPLPATLAETQAILKKYGGE